MCIGHISPLVKRPFSHWLRVAAVSCSAVCESIFAGLGVPKHTRYTALECWRRRRLRNTLYRVTFPCRKEGVHICAGLWRYCCCLTREQRLVFPFKAKTNTPFLFLYSGEENGCGRRRRGRKVPIFAKEKRKREGGRGGPAVGDFQVVVL